jgi:NitT/TauT family transport system substrate-binding protein
MNYDKRISRRHWLASMSAGAIAMSARPVVAAPLDDFIVGMNPGDMSSMAPKLAEASGTYAKYGIKAQLVSIEGGSRGMQVLLSGKIQAMQGGFSIIVNANREGADLRMVSSNGNVMLFDIYVTPNIKTPADLKGQKFAVSAFTSESDIAATLALRHWNMTRKDVMITALGGASQRMAAQLSGQAAAAPYLNPASVGAHEKGLVKMLSLSTESPPWAANGLVFQRDFLRAKPDLVKRFLKANIEAVYKGLSNPDWTKAIIAKEFQTDSKTVIDETYAQWKQTAPRDFLLSPAGVKNVIDEVNAIGPPLATRNPGDYIDNSFVEALAKEGFFEQMRKQYGIAPTGDRS